MIKETRTHGLAELSFNELSKINGGESGGYYLGKAAGAIRDWWNNLPKGYVPGEGAGYDHNAMSLPG